MWSKCPLKNGRLRLKETPKCARSGIEVTGSGAGEAAAAAGTAGRPDGPLWRGLHAFCVLSLLPVTTDNENFLGAISATDRIEELEGVPVVLSPIVGARVVVCHQLGQGH